MSTCVTTIVNKGYQKYIPIFVYFCFTSYSEYGVKLFLTEELLPQYKPSMSILKDLGDLVIVEKTFAEFPKTNQELKTLRWILTPDLFDGYDNVYIGDIDLIICRESLSLEDQHIKHCEDFNLPYSNSVRPGAKRLSGLHFVRKNPYYLKMMPTLKKYTEDLKNGKLTNTKNEFTLYNMIEKAGLGFPDSWFRPHHGIHIGLWRKGPRKVEQKYWDSIDRAAYSNYYRYYLSLKRTNDPLFKKMTRLKEVVLMEESFREEFGE